MYRQRIGLGSLCLAALCQWAAAAGPQLVVLGIAQDGGYPQAGCKKECCRQVWNTPEQRRWVSCVAIVEPDLGQTWLVDCTPDFREQLRLLQTLVDRPDAAILPQGILLTHAHIGHYSGLMHLGREVMGARGMPVYAMPRMRFFLESNGPWSQLVRLGQIDLRRLTAGERVPLGDHVHVTPFPVPHRDEFSETVGFRFDGPSRSAIYLPDIDKWERWQVRIEDLLAKTDVALLDGTFFDARELPGRDMSEIPHPFIRESLSRFESLPLVERQKIHFIHLNHTNPALRADTPAHRQIREAGMRVAVQGMRIDL